MGVIYHFYLVRMKTAAVVVVLAVVASCYTEAAPSKEKRFGGSLQNAIANHLAKQLITAAFGKRSVMEKREVTIEREARFVNALKSALANHLVKTIFTAAFGKRSLNEKREVTIERQARFGNAIANAIKSQLANQLVTALFGKREATSVAERIAAMFDTYLDVLQEYLGPLMGSDSEGHIVEVKHVIKHTLREMGQELEGLSSVEIVKLIVPKILHNLTDAGLLPF